MPNKLSERSRDILRHVVEAYVETGEPVGSRTLSRRSGLQLSPATIRNVMADLEELGLLYAPHTSAGRLPTEAGLRLFVDGILEIGNLTRDERTVIEAQCRTSGLNAGQVLEKASSLLSGLSQCAALVMAPKLAGRLRHIEFVNLGPGRALVVLVGESGDVENRVIDVPLGMPASSLVEASNYLTARMIGRTLAECRNDVRDEIREHRSELDTLASKVVENGLAVWATNEGGLDRGVLIVRGGATPAICGQVSGLDAIDTSTNGPFALALDAARTHLAIGAGPVSNPPFAEGRGQVLWATLDTTKLDDCEVAASAVVDLTEGSFASADPRTWVRAPNVLVIAELGGS